MNLQLFRFEDLCSHTYSVKAPSRIIKLKNLWSGSNFLSTSIHVNDAILIENNGWYQFLYNSNPKGLKAIKQLLLSLPDDPYKVKFVSAPKELWSCISSKWSELHFNNHYIFTFSNQKLKSSYKFDIMNANDVDFLIHNQKYIDEYGGKGYLAHRIKQCVSVILRLNSRNIGWVLQQDDGSMGFLRVDEEYRKVGIGAESLRCLINKIIDLDMPSFGYISKQNTASLGIANKLGGQILGEVSWIRMRSEKEIKNYKKGIF